MIEVRFVVLDVVQEVQFWCFEGVYGGGVGFGYFMVSIDLVVQGYQYVFVDGFFGVGQQYGVVQVDWVVSVDGGGGMYCVYDYYWFFVFDYQVQEVGGFFDGIGVVGDDDVIDVILCQQGVDVFGQFQLGFVVYVFVGDLYDLFVVYVGDFFEFRNGGDECIYVDFGSGVVDGGGVGGIGIGDGVVGGQDDDIGQVLCLCGSCCSQVEQDQYLLEDFFDEYVCF